MEKQTAIKRGGIEYFEGERVKGTLGFSRGNKTTGMKPVTVEGVIVLDVTSGEFTLFTGKEKYQLSAFTSLEKINE